MSDTLCTTVEVAKRLRVDVRTVHNLIKAGELTAFKVGARWRIPTSEVEAMIERNSSKNKI